jgi:quinol monooxygenase YgiN
MPDMPIILSVTIEAVQGREDELAALLRGLVEPTRTEPGCLGYELNSSTETHGRFLFYEKFAGQAALDEHVNSPHFKNFLAARSQSDPILKQTVMRWSTFA